MKNLYFEEGEEALWSKYMNEFVRKPEAARLNDLYAVNTWLSQEDRPTREHAALLTRHRDMEAMHRRLKGAGR